MTELETQVADAMCTDRYNGQPCRMCQHLAPRVAAAIEAAIRKATEWDHADRVADGISAGEAALAALRGETP